MVQEILTQWGLYADVAGIITEFANVDYEEDIYERTETMIRETVLYCPENIKYRVHILTNNIMTIYAPFAIGVEIVEQQGEKIDIIQKELPPPFGIDLIQVLNEHPIFRRKYPPKPCRNRNFNIGTTCPELTSALQKFRLPTK